MKYNLEEIKLRKTADGLSMFVQALVVNPDDEWDEGGLMTSFNERMVKKFSQYLQLSVKSPNLDRFGNEQWLPSQLIDQTKPLPDRFLVFDHAQFEEYVFPNGPRVALNSDGKTVRKDKNGNPIIRKSIRVLTKKSVDNETGELNYTAGWDLESVGSSIARRLYGPIEDFSPETSVGISLPQSADTQLINGVSAPQAAPPAPAPAV